MSARARRKEKESEKENPFFGFLYTDNPDFHEATCTKPPASRTAFRFSDAVRYVNCSTIVRHVGWQCGSTPRSIFPRAVVYQPYNRRTESPVLDELSIATQRTTVMLSDLRRKISDFGLLKANWDGEDAQPITPETLATALQVLERLALVLERKNIASRPSARPFPDGSVFLKWIQGQKELAITVQDRTVEAQHWQPLDAFRSEGLWQISIDDVPEHIDWVLT